jgi:hypothetical protein
MVTLISRMISKDQLFIIFLQNFNSERSLSLIFFRCKILIIFLGWSWSDITLTPPASAMLQGIERYKKETENAQKNFLQMKTFRPARDEESETTKAETTKVETTL